MARRLSEAERQLQKLSDQAREAVCEEYPEVGEILVSWAGNECTVDFKVGDEWKRASWAPDDDMELAGIRGLQ